MGIVMLVSLYTSRVVLSILGVDDFGIYTIVAGVIVMFSFMNLTLTVSIRRFLAFELGKEGGGRIQSVFNSSIIAVLLASIIIALLLESIGVWFLNSQLNIPPDRMSAANFVFHLSVFAFFVNMNLVPFSSAIVVYEKMGMYAYLGIIETILKLAFVLALPYMIGDKLKWHALFVFVLSSIIALANYYYCTHNIIRAKKITDFNWVDVYSIFKFSAWTILGTLIFMMATQGVNVIFNLFFGVAINAALGIAQQVSNAINQFVGNFQTAFNPQLTKAYSSEGLSDKTFKFVCQTSRMTILLILILCVPIIANITPILDLWLETVPDYAASFTVIFLLYMGIDGASGPLYLLVYAKGDLKIYQIILGIIQLIYILIVCILCSVGLDPIMALSANVLCVLTIYVSRLLILRKIVNFPIIQYVNEVISPLVIPLLLIIPFVILNNYWNNNMTLFSIITKIVLSLFFVTVIGFVGYLRKDERQYLYLLLKRECN